MSGLPALLLERFFGRTDCVAVLAPWGSPCPVDAIGRMDALIDGHVRGAEAPTFSVYRLDEGNRQDQLHGPFRVGSYVPDADGNTPWLSIDIDGPGHTNAVADPLGATLAIADRFKAHGIPIHLEKSGGGHGWHLWVFCEPPIPAAKVRTLALRLIPQDILLADGGMANPERNHGVEIFPKQNCIAEGGYGNLVWLPLWWGAKDGANQFHRLQNGCGLQPYTPDGFETVDEELIDRVLAETEAQAPARPSAPPASARGANHARWEQWRERALATLLLEDVYGQWLTGKTKNNGWLECRVPWSPSGDRHPSGGVADGSGTAERGSFHDFTSGETLSVFDFLLRVGRASDFRHAYRIIADLTGIELPSGNLSSAGSSTLPKIQINARQQRDVIADAWNALKAANADPPILFRRSDHLVRLGDQDGSVVVLPHNETSMHGLLLRSADWIRVNGDKRCHTSPPKDIARDILEYRDESLPALDRVIRTPVFALSGQLIQTNGYHANERLYLDLPADLSIGTIPASPDPSEITESRRLILDELLGDFPFVNAADRAHAVAALILPFVREMVVGCTPAHLVEAPIAGSGKGLLCDLVSLCATGQLAIAGKLSDKEEEARKMVTAQLSYGRAIILLDNVRDRSLLDSPTLAAVLTISAWTDRLLGESRMITLPNRALWLVTGNNLRLSTELARRSVRIRIDPRMDQPWRRTGFRHANLREWTQHNRTRLVHALLVLGRAWITAGKPLHGESLGSFEHWSQVIGGILEVAGVEGFLGNLEDFYEAADMEGQSWREFTAQWWERFGSEAKRVAELNAFCNEHDLLGAVRGDKTDRSQETKLGFALQGARDRVFGRFRIDRVLDDQHKGRTYRLVPDADNEEAGTLGTSIQTSPATSPYSNG